MKTLRYEIQGGKAIPLKGKTELARLGGNGKVEPKANEVVIVEAYGWLGERLGLSRRMVFYPGGSTTPWPLGNEVIAQPRSFNDKDMKNLHGPYLTGLLRRALDELTQESPWETIVKIATVTAALASSVAAGILITNVM